MGGVSLSRRAVYVLAIVLSLLVLTILIYTLFYNFSSNRISGVGGYNNSSKQLYSVINMRKRDGFLEVLLSYSPYSERNIVLLVLPYGRVKVNLSIIVHGGGFIGGSIKGVSFLEETFLERGFAVALVEYRVCNGTISWPIPIRDIATGVEAVKAYIEDKGIDIDYSVYIGFSAGATASAILIYSPPGSNMNLSGRVDAFIGISGVYCSSYLSEPTNLISTLCKADMQTVLLPENISSIYSKTPALLINAKDDAFDKYRGETNHHMLCLKRLLEANGVYVCTLLVDGKHDTPKKMLENSDAQLINTLFTFIDDVYSRR